MTDLPDDPDAGRWNHSVHYYGRLLAALPTRGKRVLDIGIAALWRRV